VTPSSTSLERRCIDEILALEFPDNPREAEARWAAAPIGLPSSGPGKAPPPNWQRLEQLDRREKEVLGWSRDKLIERLAALRSLRDEQERERQEQQRAEDTLIAELFPEPISPAGSVEESEQGPSAAHAESGFFAQRSEARIQAIVRKAKNLGYNVAAIPLGGKQKIKEACLKAPRLFTGSTFDKAWTLASSRGLIAIDGKERFAPKS
jgi:hypothetical protein